MRDGTRSLFCAHSHPPPIHSSSNVSHLPVPYFVGQPTLYLIACLEEGIWILSQKLFCNRKPRPLIKVWSTLLSLEALPGVVKSLPLATLIVPSTQYKSYHFFLKFSKFFLSGVCIGTLGNLDSVQYTISISSFFPQIFKVCFLCQGCGETPLATLIVPSRQNQLYLPYYSNFRKYAHPSFLP